MASRLPVVFVAHGAPYLAVDAARGMSFTLLGWEMGNLSRRSVQFGE